MGVMAKDGSDGSEGSEGKEGTNDRIIADMGAVEQKLLMPTQTCSVEAMTPYKDLYKNKTPLQIFTF